MPALLKRICCTGGKLKRGNKCGGTSRDEGVAAGLASSGPEGEAAAAEDAVEPLQRAKRRREIP